jgi:hypothetical protein
MRTTELDDALHLADRLLDEPYADPDDDLRMLARHLRRQWESHARHKEALTRANIVLTALKAEPVKVNYYSDVSDLTPICADPDGRLARRDLAERVLLQLIAIAPAMFQSGPQERERFESAAFPWKIVDAFLKAENQTCTA